MRPPEESLETGGLKPALRAPYGHLVGATVALIAAIGALAAQRVEEKLLWVLVPLAAYLAHLHLRPHRPGSKAHVARIRFPRGSAAYDTAKAIAEKWDSVTIQLGLTGQAAPVPAGHFRASREVARDWEERRYRQLRDPNADRAFPRLTFTGSASDRVTARIELVPGQTLETWVGAAEALAHALGLFAVRFFPDNSGTIRAVFLAADPLARSHSIPEAALDPDLTARDPVIASYDENGRADPLDLVEPAQHLIVAGQSGSGKSVFLQTILAQVAVRRDVRAYVIDPNGSLSRPWVGTVPLEEYLAHVEGILEPVHAEMRRRMAEELPRLDADKIVDFSPDLPLIFLCIDEWAALVALWEAHDRTVKPADRKAARLMGLVGDLLAQGRKVGLRVALGLQRADSSNFPPGARENAAARYLFRMPSEDGKRMLFPGLPEDLSVAIANAAPGVMVNESLAHDRKLSRAALLPGPLHKQHQAYVSVVKDNLG